MIACLLCPSVKVQLLFASQLNNRDLSKNVNEILKLLFITTNIFSKHYIKVCMPLVSHTGLKLEKCWAVTFQVNLLAIRFNFLPYIACCFMVLRSRKENKRRETKIQWITNNGFRNTKGTEIHFCVLSKGRITIFWTPIWGGSQFLSHFFKT